MTLRVKVIPRSSKSEMAGTLADGTVKIKIAAPPEKGKANEALISFLAEHYGVARTSVRIVAGHTSQRKVVEIET